MDAGTRDLWKSTRREEESLVLGVVMWLVRQILSFLSMGHFQYEEVEFFPVGLTSDGNYVTIGLNMQKEEEFNKILSRIKADDFFLRIHASERMHERRIERLLIIHCAETCFLWKWQEDHQTHLFLGYFLDGKSGGFSAVLEDTAIVVTVFKRRLNAWERTIAKSKRRLKE
jgi:hypothetical protein